ncbi:hypothetical protein BXP70_26270 [Hymenobacter crusticola]|uniref:Fibronectin type-III domain-containing protein n=1 Tax=Hymenobacter crusticola TaxID=1770526 RepID=A0A243W674_9BACT|nr:hypothetical protein BXP70_26270 [Hymenobacter crusticola]
MLVLLGQTGLVQAQALTLATLSPARNALVAPPTTSVTVDFSQPLSTGAATQQALKVFSAQAGGQKAGVSVVTGNRLSFRPSLGFKAGETVFTTVTDAVQSSSGQALGKPEVFQFTVATAPSPGTFSGGTEVAINRNAFSSVLGDVDNDGDLDLLTASSNAATGTGLVSVSLNDGGGTFRPGPEVMIGNVALAESHHVVLGDLDGDGDLDFAVPTSDGHTVSLCFNNGHGVFSGTQEIETPYAAYTAAFGDVDSDGDLDLLVPQLSPNLNTVRVYLNDGRGTFSRGAEVTVPRQSGYVALTVGDVDNDGDLDLLTVNPAQNNVSVRLNNGNGTFSGGQDIAAGTYPTNIVLGDVDGDGDLDFVTGSGTSIETTASVRLNNGSGVFSGSQQVRVGTTPRNLALGDVDGDGDLDLMTANTNSGTVSVRQNNGAGTFAGEQTVPVGLTPLSVALGDVNGDGDLDVVAANGLEQTVSVRLNQGLANPAITGIVPGISPVGSTVVINGTAFLGATRIAFNGVAAIDFMVNRLGTQITVTVPAGATSGPVVVSTAVGSSNSFPFEVGPLLTVTALTPNRNALARPRNTLIAATLSQPLSQGDATLRALHVFSQQTGAETAGSTMVSSNILTFDPSTDFKAGETVFVTLTKGAQSTSGVSLAKPQVFQFTTATSPSTGVFELGPTLAPASYSSAEVLGDVDGDGDLDLLVASSSEGIVSVRLNDGTGAFVDSRQLNIANRVGIKLGDVDGDGDLDLLTVNGQGVDVYFNDGSGAFANPRSVAVDGAVFDTTFGDIDGDGDLDLLAAVFYDLYNSGVSVRLNDGTGTFGDAQLVRVGATIVAVALGDVDGDGDLDLLTTDGPSRAVQISLNTGIGTFGLSSTVTVGEDPVRTVPADLDADGDLDLLTVNRQSHTVSVWRNTGTGTFANPTSVSVGLLPFNLTVADLDGDGDLDFVTPNARANSLSVRLNNGSAQFTANQEVSGTNGPISVIPGDVDGDGDLDLLALSGEGRVQQYFNVNNDQLIVTALSPAPNTIAAPRATSVGVTFNQPLRSQAATQGALQVFSQQAGGKKAGTATSTGPTLTFDPTTDFKAGETVTATLTRAAQSNSGQNLGRAQVFQFTTTTLPSPGTFSGDSESSTDNGPVSVTAGDVDGDGDLDLLTTNLGNVNSPNGLGNGTTITVRRNDGTGTFTNAQHLTVGRGPTQAVLADLNGDGTLDLLTANSSSATVSVRLNTGSGSFGPGAEVGSGNIHGIAVGDVDGDGDQDLLLADYNEPSTVAIGLNNGTGTFPFFDFSAARRVSVGSRPINIALGDVDGDGDLDFVTSSSNGTTVSVRVNNGTGIFTGTQEVGVGFNPMQVVLGDVDGDGDLDVVTANYYNYFNPAINYTNSTASVRLNNGNGLFAGDQQVAIGRGARSVALGDVDGDGDLDLLAPNELTNSVGVRLNNGSGAFSGSQQVAVGDNPTYLALADLDGDGDLDFATANFLGNTLSVRLNQAAAEPLLITAVSPSRNAVATPRPTPVAVTFNQPLRASSGMTAQALRVFGTQSGRKAGFYDVSSNTLRLAPTVPFKPGETVYATVTTAVQSSSGAPLVTPHVFQFTAAASPSTGLFNTGLNPVVGTTPHGLAAGDLDGDGTLDFVTANLNSNTVSVRLNHGAGSFSSTQEISVGRGARSVVLGDVDADGDLDLVTANSRTIFPGTVSVRLNNGAGRFAGTQEVVVGDTPHAVMLGDVDGDGDLDLLAANYTAGSSLTSSTVSVRLNDGTGSFGGTQEVTVGTRPLSLALGDLDNDGDLDFVTANSNTTTASVRVNDGLGNFSGMTEVPAEFNPEAVALGDVDGDGDLDLTTAHRASGTVNVRRNDGRGNFTGTQRLLVGATPHSIVLGDLDGDGDLDLVTANTGSNTTSVRLNNGSGTFSGTQDVNVGAGPLGLTLGDVDGNGTLDLLTASSATNSASIRFNGVTSLQAKVLVVAPAHLQDQISLYPNPAHAHVRLRLPAELIQSGMQVQVFNTLGQLVLAQALPPQQETELWLAALHTGVYSVHLTTTQGVVIKRLVIE